MCQTKAYWKANSTNDSLAVDMASKIDAVHGLHNTCSSRASTTGVHSSSDVVNNAISIAQQFEKQNLDLTAQVSILVGSHRADNAVVAVARCN